MTRELHSRATAGTATSRPQARARLARAGLPAAGKALRRGIERFLYAHHQVLVYACPPEASRSRSRQPNSSFTVKAVALEELERAVTDHPEYLNATRLRRYRRRLECGDTGHAVYKDGKLAHLAWLGECEEVTAVYEVGTDCRIPLDQPALLIRDCWTPRGFRGQGIYRAVLRHLAELASDQGRSVWVCCEVGNLASKAGIEAAGFRLHSRFHQVKWLGFQRRAWVERVPPDLDSGA